MVNYLICVFPHVAEIFGHCPAPGLHPSCCLALISLAQLLSCSLSWFLLGSELLICGGASNPGVIFTLLLWKLCLGLLTNRRVSRDSPWVYFAGSFMFLRYIDYCFFTWILGPVLSGCYFCVFLPVHGISVIHVLVSLVIFFQPLLDLIMFLHSLLVLVVFSSTMWKDFQRSLLLSPVHASGSGVPRDCFQFLICWLL